MSELLGRPNRLAVLASLGDPPDRLAAKLASIERGLLAESPRIDGVQFTRIGDADLAWLFGAYDREFFAGRLAAILAEDRSGPVAFRFSSRLTSAGGKTTMRGPRRPGRSTRPGERRYEIAVSSLLLAQTFAAIDRPVEVAGLTCRNRLEALLRIFEHELIHLAEFLATGQSNCSGDPFRSLAWSIFGHRAWKHNLVTPREVAATTHDLRVGDLVAFAYQGAERVGRLVRITKRATVLVPDPAGEPYSDGLRYLRFYVPLVSLRPMR